MIHATVLTDQGIPNIPAMRQSASVKKSITVEKSMTQIGMTPETKKKKTTKASLLNQYSTMINKNYDDEKSVNLNNSNLLSSNLCHNIDIES